VKFLASNTIFEGSGLASQDTHCISIAKISHLILFRKIVTVYCVSYTKQINILWDKMQKFYILIQVIHVLLVKVALKQDLKCECGMR
jgi:hypothetical protein